MAVVGTARLLLAAATVRKEGAVADATVSAATLAASSVVPDCNSGTLELPAGGSTVEVCVKNTETVAGNLYLRVRTVRANSEERLTWMEAAACRRENRRTLRVGLSLRGGPPHYTSMTVTRSPAPSNIPVTGVRWQGAQVFSGLAPEGTAFTLSRPLTAGTGRLLITWLAPLPRTQYTFTVTVSGTEVHPWTFSCSVDW